MCPSSVEVVAPLKARAGYQKLQPGKVLVLDLVWRGRRMSDQKAAGLGLGRADFRLKGEAADLGLGLTSDWFSEEYQGPAFCIGFTQTCE